MNFISTALAEGLYTPLLLLGASRDGLLRHRPRSQHYCSGSSPMVRLRSDHHIVLDSVKIDGSPRNFGNRMLPRDAILTLPVQTEVAVINHRQLVLPPPSLRPTSARRERPTSARREPFDARAISRRPVSAHLRSTARPLSARTIPRPESATIAGRIGHAEYPPRTPTPEQGMDVDAQLDDGGGLLLQHMHQSQPAPVLLPLPTVPVPPPPSRAMPQSPKPASPRARFKLAPGAAPTAAAVRGDAIGGAAPSHAPSVGAAPRASSLTLSSGVVLKSGVGPRSPGGRCGPPSPARGCVSVGMRPFEDGVSSSPPRRGARRSEEGAFLTEVKQDEAMARAPAPARSRAAAGAVDGSDDESGAGAVNPLTQLQDYHTLPADAKKRSAREKARAALDALLAMSAEAYVELAFEAASQMKLDFSEEAEKAARDYDVRHQMVSQAARQHLLQLEVTPTDIEVRKRFNHSVRDCRRNRYFIPESAGGYRAIKPRRRRKARWRLETSCWALRLTDGNSKDFFETDEAMKGIFTADWDIARRAHELSWHIIKTQNDPSNWKHLDKGAAVSGANFAEVDEVRDELWRHFRMIYGAFDCKGAVLFGFDLSHSLPQEQYYVSLCSLRSLFTPCSDRSYMLGAPLLLTVSARVAGRLRRALLGERERPRGARRLQHFLQRLHAVLRGVWDDLEEGAPRGVRDDLGARECDRQGDWCGGEAQQGQVSQPAGVLPVPRALRDRGLCEEREDRRRVRLGAAAAHRQHEPQPAPLRHAELKRLPQAHVLHREDFGTPRIAALDRSEIPSPRVASLTRTHRVVNASRGQRARSPVSLCVRPPVQVVLEANLGSIKTLYEQYAEVSHQQGDDLKDDALMSIGEWMAFCSHLGLIESRQLSVSQAKYIFIWSRIRSIKNNSDREEIRLRHLFPVDFLEALVRMATMISLPTDEEIEEVGATDAGEFLLAMQIDSPNSYRSFLESHRPKHKDPDCSDWEKHCLQPIWRCVEHLIKLLVRTIEINTSAIKDDEAADGVVQASEASKFIKQRSQGAAIMKRRGSVLADTDYETALENAALRKLMTAAAICIQMMMRSRAAKKRVAQLRLARAQAHESADKDNDGKLDFAEFCAFVRSREEGDFTDAELRKRFDLLDADGSGEVDMSEYVDSKHAAI